MRMMETSSTDVPEAALAEQLDEVQLLEAMAGREGEFEWRREENGRITGRIQVFLNLERELDVCLARRERYVVVWRVPIDTTVLRCVSLHSYMQWIHFGTQIV